ncbi:MAG TPA: hypothetical protein DCQ50_01540 [Chryseobacterium sp.]|nr:hypothetical protein [Chryseobacterium sp.]
MKLRSSIKSSAKETATQVIQKTVKATDKPIGRFRLWTQKHPVASLVIMFAIVLLNVAALFVFTDSFKSVAFSYKTIKSNLKDDGKSINDMGIPFTFKNYREMISIQDTLQYLANKPNRTASDTAILLRLFDKMEKLDPQFFNKIKQLQHEKDSVPKSK